MPACGHVRLPACGPSAMPTRGSVNTRLAWTGVATTTTGTGGRAATDGSTAAWASAWAEAFWRRKPWAAGRADSRRSSEPARRSDRPPLAGADRHTVANFLDDLSKSHLIAMATSALSFVRRRQVAAYLPADKGHYHIFHGRAKGGDYGAEWEGKGRLRVIFV